MTVVMVMMATKMLEEEEEEEEGCLAGRGLISPTSEAADQLPLGRLMRVAATLDNKQLTFKGCAGRVQSLFLWHLFPFPLTIQRPPPLSKD